MIPRIENFDYFYQWREKTNLLATLMGDIETIDVAAADRDTLVEALNKVISNIGPLSTLTTTAKNTIVAAINEHQTKIGNATLTLTAQDLTSAVNELDGDIGTPASLTTTAKNNLVAAINEIDSQVGDLALLKTTDKDSVVDGINEVFDLNLIGNVTFTIGSESSDVIRVTAQLKNGQGNNIAFSANVFAYLSDNADGSTLMATEHSGGWAIGDAGLIIPQTANKVARFTSNATGAFNVDITETGAKTAYLVVTLPNGKNVVSGAITHEV